MEAATRFVEADVGPERVGELLRLYAATWWAADRRRTDVVEALAASDVALGLVDSTSDRLVAFARALTDGVYVAVVLDVIVAEEHRGRGLGARLMASLLGHPRLGGVRSVELVCQPELVAFYSRWGFARVGRSRLMRRTDDPALTSARA